MNQSPQPTFVARQQAPDVRRPHELAPPPARVAIVAARWHADLVQQAADAARAALAFAPGERPVEVESHEVPGALEIPLFAQHLARSGRHDAVIAIAFVVDGGIYRHEFVAQAVVEGLMRVQLDTGVPVLSCVLTPQAFHEHDVHRRFFAEHMAAKGREVAEACLGMLAALRGLTSAAQPMA